MTKQLMHISPRQTAKVIAVLWFAFTLPFILMMGAIILGSNAPNKPSVAFLLVFPVLYAVFGYVFTLFGAWIYNQVAKRIGGIEFTTAEAPAKSSVKP